MLNRRTFNGAALTSLGSMSGCILMGNRHALQASDWLSWRGNHRDGSTGLQSWPRSLSEDMLELQWESRLDNGYSGPVTCRGLVFVTETRDSKDEVVTAFNLQSGEVQWTVQWPGSLSVPFFAKENGDWIRSTPTCDNERLYVGGMRDVLVALDCESGAEVWRIDFPAQLGSTLPSFGFVCSPLMDGNCLYVQAGGGLVAVRPISGEVLWKSLDDGGGMWGSAFSSPIMTTLHGRRQLVVQTRTHLCGIEPQDGSKIWEIKIEAFRGMNILTPIVWKDCIFTSSYGGKSLLLELEPSESGLWGVKPRWVNKTEAYMSSPVIIDQTLYLHLRNRRLACLNLETGKENWITKPFGRYWSMLTNGQQILALDERGILLLIDHDPAEFRLIDEREVSQHPSWAHLALVEDRLLVRHLKGLSVFRWGV